MKKTLEILVILFAIVACPLSQEDSQEDSQDASTLIEGLGLAASAQNVSLPVGTDNGSVDPNATALSIKSYTPSNNSVSNDSTIDVVINFNIPVNTDTVESAFSVNDGNINRTGNFVWSNDNKTLTWTPTSLRKFAVHTITITTDAKSADGVALNSQLQFTFRIGPFFNLNGLTWISGNVEESFVISPCTNVGNHCTYQELYNFCNSLGMRIPTYTELYNARYDNNVFNPVHTIYTDLRSSTNSGGDDKHYRVRNTGVKISTYDNARTLVRCVLD